MYLRTVNDARTTKFLPIWLPRRHIFTVFAISLMMAIFSISTPAKHSTDHRRKIPLELELPISLPSDANTAPVAERHSLPATSDEPLSPEASLQDIAAPAVLKPPAAESLASNQQTPSWTTIKVRPGDSLSRLFKRVGLSDKQMHSLIRSTDQARELRRLHPGEELGFQIVGGELQAVRHVKSPLETLLIQQEGSRFTAKKAFRDPQVVLRYSEATITDSLFRAGESAELPHSIIMNLANIFGGVIDFVYDIRLGDSFSVLYEEQQLDGKRYDAGRILAASFTNQSTVYKAYYYSANSTQAGYYNDQGVSMQKAFLRAPVDFTRISSKFNPSRLHPILKTRRPHRGIDYAASRGTPVFSTGAGKVTDAGYSRANGNYLVIDHGSGFVTKYLHLKKKTVTRGQRVKQGTVIGQVGSTGYATGPHLHYEFLLNGVHRNPSIIHKRLPKAKTVAKADLSHFKEAIQPLAIKLAAHQKAHFSAATSTATALH